MTSVSGGAGAAMLPSGVEEAAWISCRGHRASAEAKDSLQTFLGPVRST